VRIFTGAVVPDFADSVIMQEPVKVTGERIELPADTVPLQNVRLAGEDVSQGAELLSAGKKLTAMDLALLAAAGVAKVSVTRRLRIAIFSTGDELTAVGQPLSSGKIYDSNRYLLRGLLTDPAYCVTDGGVIADNPQELKARFLAAAANHDVLISTGGASVGDADYIREILAECGTVDFWKLAIKPGKPLAFGTIAGCYFFGLPGNPVAVSTTFSICVQPALQALSGELARQPLRISATCQSRLKKSAGRQEYQRGILSRDENGTFVVVSAGRQGSHILSSLSKANCTIVLPAECQGITVGEQVSVEPFSTFI
jgi:molybdopterin molybdotransferase